VRFFSELPHPPRFMLTVDNGTNDLMDFSVQATSSGRIACGKSWEEVLLDGAESGAADSRLAKSPKA